MEIPRIKKKLSAFLLEDEGKISKQSLLALGAVVSSFALSAAISSKDVIASCVDGHPKPTLQHVNNANNVLDNGIMTVKHGHHGSHNSHASHCSHGSHGSHGQW